MNKDDFIKTINGELFYRYDYAYWLYSQLEEKDKELEKLQLELDRTNSTLKKYAIKLIQISHLHDHFVEYDYREFDYREFDKLLEEVLYNE